MSPQSAVMARPCNAPRVANTSAPKACIASRTLPGQCGAARHSTTAWVHSASGQAHPPPSCTGLLNVAAVRAAPTTITGVCAMTGRITVRQSRRTDSAVYKSAMPLMHASQAARANLVVTKVSICSAATATSHSVAKPMSSGSAIASLCLTKPRLPWTVPPNFCTKYAAANDAAAAISALKKYVLNTLVGTPKRSYANNIEKPESTSSA